MRFTIVLEPEEAGGYSVFCPALPGCYSQGDTREEALANIKEAIECHLASMKKDGLPISPGEVEIEIATVEVTA